MTKRRNIIPIFIPHQGCNNECIFCNQRHITGVEENIIDIDEQINTYLSYFSNIEDMEVAFYGGSFTGLSKDLMVNYLQKVQVYIKSGLITSIRVSTRPDYINEDILALLRAYNVKTIELGVQSTVDHVLKANKRATTRDEIISSSKLIKASGFNLGLQMMTALYKSSKEDDIKTAFEISRLDPDFVRIYPTMILPNTKLYQYYKSGKYSPMILEDMFSLLKTIVMIFEAENIDIIRIGLHSDGNEKDNEMIGPFHPATRQIVYSRIFGDLLKESIRSLDSEQITVYGNKKQIDYLSGYKGQNRKEIEKRNISVSFYSSDIEENTIVIDDGYKELYLDFSDYCRMKIGEIYETEKN